MPDEREIVHKLTLEWLRWAEAARYPDKEEPVSRKEAKEAVTLAANVYAWGSALIQKAVK